MYSIYEALLKESILAMTVEEQDKLIKLLEKKNGVSFNDNRLNAILNHLELLSLTDANAIIQKYISPETNLRSNIMKKLKEFINSEVMAIIVVVFICSFIIFFGLQNL